MVMERGLNDENCAASYDDTGVCTPAWAEQDHRRARGLRRSSRVARRFAGKREAKTRTGVQ
ncbi:hypothetical protein KCP78_07790 [Salmonella enterica subsp. enterica]|nr:hypothetical protein KCP78_07790 [Salmonella enterica subsp. enterica]